MTRMKYLAPKTKDGKIQHVPVVVKNRDVLIGYINCMENIMSSLSLNGGINLEELTNFDPGIDSSRFNSYIDDGVNSSLLSEEEVEKIMNEKIANIFGNSSSHSENGSGILVGGYFCLDCTGCGNFVRWNSAKEIPHENFRCDICDRVLVHYIHLDDEDIEFDECKYDSEKGLNNNQENN